MDVYILSPVREQQIEVNYIPSVEANGHCLDSILKFYY